MKTIKLPAVASIGGHWKQLLRIVSPVDCVDCAGGNTETGVEIVYVSTHPQCASLVEGRNYHTIRDFSRWDFYRIIPVMFQAWKILRKEKPDLVISTGAAPGLVTLFVAKLLGKKTIWIDSVANIERLSFSGKIASLFASQTYTQWESLATSKILYAGNVFDLS